MNILNRAESTENMALDRAAQILATGKAETVSNLLQAIASVSVTDVTKVSVICIAYITFLRKASNFTIRNFFSFFKMCFMVSRKH